MELNAYGDSIIECAGGFGIDISGQRLDDLDLRILGEIERRASLGESTRVLELGCGSRGICSSISPTHTECVALDREDYSLSLAGHVSFVQSVLPKIPEHLKTYSPNIIVSQRALHYLEYSDFLSVLKWCNKYMRQDGRIYLSVSGLDSELGRGYSGKPFPITHRMHLLDIAMQKKHKIIHPVCLFRKSELACAVENAGFSINEIWESEFGNIKLTGEVLND